jgi:hypothetical protein
VVGGGAEPSSAPGVQGEVAQRRGQRGRVAARDQDAVEAVAHDVAVARDVRRDDRRALREGLGEHHPEALAAQRRRAQHVGGGEDALLGLVAGLAEHAHAAVVEEQRLDLVRLRAHERQPRRDVLAQGLEGAQQDGQPLALDRLADEGDVEHAVVLALGRPVGDVDAVRDHPVRPAVPARRRPRGGLGDRDAHGDVVEAPRRAREVHQHRRPRARRVGVEGRDDRRGRAEHGVPANRRGVRGVDVHDVVAARAQLVAQAGERRGRQGEVRDRPVGGQARRAAERDEVRRQRPGSGPGAAVQPGDPAGVAVDGGQDAHVVALPEQLLGEGLDVARHTARIGPRVRRDEGDPHGASLSPS